MIKNKTDYKKYIYQDKIALGFTKKRPRMFYDEIWRFEKLLRKCEYYKNCHKSLFSRVYLKFLLIKFHKLSVKLGFSIPLNVFGPGLSIAHYGVITVNGSARVGKNCRIHESTCIGATNGTNDAPIIGDNVFIGTGAKLIGNIKIGDNVAIGAGALVNKSFEENGITIGGIPAKKISNNNSHSNLNKLLKENKLL